MADEIPELANGSHSSILNINDDERNRKYVGPSSPTCSQTLRFMQKLMGEFMGTYLLLFAGFAAVVVNKEMNNLLTFPGVAVLWGLDVMVMIYTVGHVSGAHFNPAVTIAFATCNRFAWRHVAAYVSVQVLASILASGTVEIIFGTEQHHFLGTLPSGSNIQSLVLEFIITFYLMFAVSGVATDDQAVGELSGLALGATVTINSLLAGPISGASMNPARSLGPAIVFSNYKGIWIYIVGPITGAIAGAWFYNIIRLTHKPFSEILSIRCFHRNSARIDSKQQGH
ncbi:aquaporin NIP1-1-like isoform X1 [Sesamum indicum]|uniref:Aquaporin NIP1-1-like isoform X1 n=1 Tax=Sesamum indicum TaxID=4182 RepID=A0A6I9USN2_SESIN|nr:aquaporin NIP1-1-like isoform X1 [Sesamum indicum]